jgi:anti-sigma regulatory factor (Ser/Thr protein kinase)
MTITSVIAVDESSRVGEVRRAIAVLAGRVGLGETEAGRAAIVANELATNLVKYARGVEIASVDVGPGMDVGRSLRDGHSTTGSRGVGLGAVARSSDAFDAASWEGIGSFVVSRIWAGGDKAPEKAAMGGDAPGVVTVPYPGELACGDLACVIPGPGGSMIAAVIDGLGHGVPASDAARAFEAVLRAEAHRSPGEIVEAAHLALRSTRGAAASVVKLLPHAQKMVHAGIGNVAVDVLDDSGRARSCVSLHGIVGAQVRRVREEDHAVPAGSLVVLASDGLSSSWRMERTPGLATRSPALVAAALYRLYRRGTDDATVLALRV